MAKSLAGYSCREMTEHTQRRNAKHNAKSAFSTSDWLWLEPHCAKPITGLHLTLRDFSLWSLELMFGALSSFQNWSLEYKGVRESASLKDSSEGLKV